jgi:Mrp family chromosome partitioning ATPase
MAVTENAARSSTAVRGGTPSRALVTASACPPRVVEAYHTLLTNIDLALGADAGGMVAVAAIDETVDAAPVAANLALVAAQSGDRTLLVDCDVQLPRLNGVFDLDTAPGLAQLLDGAHNDLRALAQPTTLPTLGVIVAGLSGARHNRLTRLGDVPAALLRLKNAADRVFLSAPPVLAGSDLLRLAAYVDGILIVIAPGQTGREEAARARALLDKAAAPLLGAALVPR